MSDELDTIGKTYVATPPTFRAIVWDGKAETVDLLSSALGHYDVQVKYHGGNFILSVRDTDDFTKFRLVEVGVVFVINNRYDHAKGSFPYMMMSPQRFKESYQEA